MNIRGSGNVSRQVVSAPLRGGTLLRQNATLMMHSTNKTKQNREFALTNSSQPEGGRIEASGE